MRSRHGFTLVEMLLVLAILVVAAALALPFADSMYRGARTRAAADAVKAGLVEARTHAMEESRAYRFSIHPGGVAFRVAPDDDAFWSGAGDGSAQSSNIPPFIYAENMPGGIRFGGGTPPPMTGPNQPPPVDPPAATIDPGQFETRVVFYATGEADADFEMAFTLPGARPLLLSLRGMTGVATIRFQNQVQPGATNP